MENRFKTGAKSIAMAAALVAAAFVSSGSQALAKNISPNVKKADSVVFLTFDWHANGRDRSAERIILIGGSSKGLSKRRSNGKGTYVCSISGAGQRSRCNMRS